MIYREQLIYQIQEVEQQYYKACKLNYGHEGTVISLGYRYQLDILIKLLNDYFEENYSYTRML